MSTVKVEARALQINRRIDAVSYYRMSSDQQDKSIDQQRAEVESWATANNYHIIREYADEGISGDDTVKRKQFQRMMLDAEGADFQAILCWDQDRFGRFDSTESGFWTHPLRQNGIHLATVVQGVIDWNSFTGRVMYAINQEGNNQFLKKLAGNVTRGFLEKARQGKWVGGTPPLGMKVCLTTGKLVPGNDDEVLVVLRIFTLYDSGMSLSAITDELNTSGHNPRTNNKWCRSSVRVVLRSPYYTGDFIWPLRSRGQHCCVRDGKVSNDLGDVGKPIFLPDNHASLINKELFRRVQAKLENNRANTTPVRNGGNFYFTGLLFCQNCGSRMSGLNEKTKQGGIRTYYRCSGPSLYGKSFCFRNLIRQEELVEVVLRQMENWAKDPARRRAIEAITNELIRKAPGIASVPILKKKVAQLDKEIGIATRNLLMLSLPSAVPIAEKHLAELLELKSQAERDLKVASTPISEIKSQLTGDFDRKVQLIENLRELIQISEPFGVRQTFKELIERFELKFDQTPSKSGKRLLYSVVGGDLWLSKEILAHTPLLA